MASIAVIGTGYVGITTAACLASLGQDVHATDIDAERIAQLNEGVVPILEPGLDELLAGGLATRRSVSRQTTGPQPARQSSFFSARRRHRGLMGLWTRAPSTTL